MGGGAHMPTLWLALHFAIGLAGTWLALRYAQRRRLFDQPGERRSHAVATPRGGGISLVASLLVAIILLALAVDAPRSQAAVLLPVGAGLAAVAGIGWADDHRPLSPWWRLVVHVAAAGCLAWAVRASGGGTWFMLLAFVAAVVLVNVWNFMDGIDGIASSQAAIVALGYALSAREGVPFWLGTALAAAACGFLPFNVPRARIFLGDVGSGALGYAIATLLAFAAIGHGQRDLGWLALLLPLSPFLVDASLTLAARMLRGERWWEPHVQHAYQRWARSGGSHLRVTAAYALAALACMLLMFHARSSSAPVQLGMIGMVWLAGGMVWRHFRRHG